MALLDTTVLIDLTRKPSSPARARAAAQVSALLNRGDVLVTSRVNEAEFRVGPERASNRALELENVERVLAGLVIVELDAAAAAEYARIKGRLLEQGTPIGDCDTLIAAIAIANGELIVTANPRHFAEVPGLKVESY